MGWISLALIMLCFLNLAITELFLSRCISFVSANTNLSVPRGIFAFREKLKWVKKHRSGMPEEARRYADTVLLLDKVQIVLVLCTIVFVVFAGWQK